MTRINWVHVLLGGLLAAVVIFLGEALYSIVLGRELASAMEQALGRRPTENGATLALGVVLTLGVGIAGVWLYAAVRSRFGPGPRTAAIAGVAYWVIGYVFPSMAWGELVSFPRRLVAMSTLWELPEIVLAILLGAWVYKE